MLLIPPPFRVRHRARTLSPNVGCVASGRGPTGSRPPSSAQSFARSRACLPRRIIRIVVAAGEPGLAILRVESRMMSDSPARLSARSLCGNRPRRSPARQAGFRPQKSDSDEARHLQRSLGARRQAHPRRRPALLGRLARLRRRWTRVANHAREYAGPRSGHSPRGQLGRFLS